MWRNFSYLFFLLLIALAVFTRFESLDIKPLHADEAMQAHQLETLMMQGEYAFNPKHAHGPTLYYLTDWFLHLIGVSASELDESNIRLLPVIAGSLLLFTPLCLRRYLPTTGMLASIVLLAISPALVYYCRYFIQETFFALFATYFVFCVGKIFLSRSDFKESSWLFVGAGLSLGLAYATKETIAITVIAALLALPFGFGIIRSWEIFSRAIRNIYKFPVLLFPLLAIIVSSLFYSSFGKNPHGILDGFATFFSYEVISGHEKPFLFYLSTWGLGSIHNQLYWGEAWIFLGGSIGLILTYFPTREDKKENLMLLRFIGVYGLFALIIYSFIAYKTPWLVLSIIPSFCILAGYSFWRLTYHSMRDEEKALCIIVLSLLAMIVIILSPKVSIGTLLLGQSREVKQFFMTILPAKGTVIVITMLPLIYSVGAFLINLFAGTYIRIHWRAAQMCAAAIIAILCIFSLGQQVFVENFVFHSDPRNPYAYSATSPDLPRLVDDLVRERKLSPTPLTIFVYSENSWPLPWYLRQFKHVGYWKDGTMREGADVYIFSADLSVPPPAPPENYRSSIYGLRSEIPLVVYWRE